MFEHINNFLKGKKTQLSLNTIYLIVLFKFLLREGTNFGRGESLENPSRMPINSDTPKNHSYKTVTHLIKVLIPKYLYDVTYISLKQCKKTKVWSQP